MEKVVEVDARGSGVGTRRNHLAMMSYLPVRAMAQSHCGNSAISPLCLAYEACISEFERVLAHMPAMAHADRLPGERVGLEGGEEQGHVSDILDRCELLVHCLGEHNLLDHALLADAELLGLFGD